MSLPFMRPVREEDFDAILSLARQSGGGMTNLPSDTKTLKARIKFACECYEKNAGKPGGEIYSLVLEKDGKAIGIAAVFSSIGLESGFINYKINHEFYGSKELNKRSIRRVLIPTHDFTACAEVGSLFISPTVRGGGLGKLLARSRYMFIAQKPEIIADHICAELRGWRAPDGAQPFWNAVGRRFFEMDFEEADAANAAHGNQFIEDMMPRYPIYADLMPEDARNCLGRPHDSALPAYRMLLNEGFVYNDYIDVFDGGPLVDTPTMNIRTIRESRVLTLSEIAEAAGAADALLAAGSVSTFRAVKAKARIKEDEIVFNAETADALGVKKGDQVRWAPW
ncbi:MAG: arginine N-succinyltransferase [Alphaproteobacteria bacterium]|nr:arginine N-succinyltransferase [Alphaproteobacteria bacterium]